MILNPEKFNENPEENENFNKIIDQMVNDGLDLRHLLFIINKINKDDDKPYNNDVLINTILNRYNIKGKDFLKLKSLIITRLEILGIISISSSEDEKFIGLIDRIKESELNLKKNETNTEHILAEINRIRRGETSINDSFLNDFGVNGNDIPHLRRILEDYVMGKLLIGGYLSAQPPKPYDEDLDFQDIIPKNNQKKSPDNQEKSPDKPSDKYVCFDISVINGEVFIVGCNINESEETKTEVYSKGNKFTLKKDTKVFSLNPNENNIDIKDLISHEFIVTRGTYLLHNYGEPAGTKAFFVKIKDLATEKEYITYSI